MRILYLSQYFPPEIGATQTRAYEMARGFVKAGHQVTIITEFPNHPVGIIPEGYKKKVFVREEMEGIEVIRAWVKASPVKDFSGRMAFYLSYMVMAAFAGLFLTRGKFDALYATSPPLFVGGAGLVISYFRCLPMFFEVRDLWPESAVQLGQLNRPWAIRLATWLEQGCYQRARRVIAVTEGIKQSLVERGIQPGKIGVIPNGANVDLYQNRAADKKLMDQLSLTSDHFILIYTGLIGLIHDLESVLEAADLLRGQPARFLIIGDGPKKTELEVLRDKMDLDNVILHDAVPERELPAFLALAHVGLHTQRRLDISHMSLPVKMFSYMACELPVILAIEGEAANLLQEAEAGIVVPPEDPKALVDAIQKLMADPELCRQYGENGRRLVESRFSRQKLALNLASLIDDALRGD